MIEVRIGHRPPEGRPRQRRENLLRAGLFVRRTRGTAAEHLAAARRLAHAGDVARAGDAERVRCRRPVTPGTSAARLFNAVSDGITKSCTGPSARLMNAAETSRGPPRSSSAGS